MVVTVWNGGSVQLHLDLMVQIENGYPSGVRLDNVWFSWWSDGVEEIRESLEKINEDDDCSRSLRSCHLLWYVKDGSELIGHVQSVDCVNQIFVLSINGKSDVFEVHLVIS
jgi:hypothetical protein